MKKLTDMEIWQDEIFAPVLFIVRVTDLSEAIPEKYWNRYAFEKVKSYIISENYSFLY